MSWNADQYLKFAEPRLRPAVDLLARVPGDSPKRVYDLGCGAGNVTRLLVDRWPQSAVVGVDNSEEMLVKARSALPAVTWIRASVAEWEPDGPADVIFSNAALHWLPHHERLFPAIAGRLAPGGVLAIQMPNNFSAPSHTGIADTVHAGPWKTRLLPLLGPSPVASPGEYYQYLSGHVDEIDIWETEYLQVLRGQDPVKEWTKGTWLKRFLDALEGAEAIEFEEQYAARMRVAYPQRADGTTLFPFRRLFIVARRG